MWHQPDRLAPPLARGGPNLAIAWKDYGRVTNPQPGAMGFAIVSSMLGSNE